MQSELQKLRIDESHRARRDERPIWPWFIAIVFLLPNGVLAFSEGLLNRLRGLTREVAR